MFFIYMNELMKAKYIINMTALNHWQPSFANAVSNCKRFLSVHLSSLLYLSVLSDWINLFASMLQSPSADVQLESQPRSVEINTTHSKKSIWTASKREISKQGFHIISHRTVKSQAPWDILHPEEYQDSIVWIIVKKVHLLNKSS